MVKTSFKGLILRMICDSIFIFLRTQKNRRINQAFI
jgi:hypothetical protein